MTVFSRFEHFDLKICVTLVVCVMGGIRWHNSLAIVSCMLNVNWAAPEIWVKYQDILQSQKVTFCILKLLEMGVIRLRSVFVDLVTVTTYEDNLFFDMSWQTWRRFIANSLDSGLSQSSVWCSKVVCMKLLYTPCSKEKSIVTIKSHFVTLQYLTTDHLQFKKAHFVVHNQ